MKNTALTNIFTLFLISIALTGCRFGNHADQAQPLKTGNTFARVELYNTAAKQLETQIYLNSIDGPDSIVNTITNAPLASIPAGLLNVFTSAVYFTVPKDLTQDNPAFYDRSGNYKFETLIDANGNPKYSSPDDGYGDTVWENQDCITYDHISHAGSFDLTHPGTTTDGNGGTVATLGRAKFDYTYFRVFESLHGDENCTADLTYLAGCYADGVGCDSSTIAYSKRLFDMFVRQTGSLRIEDIPKVKAMAYMVRYE